MYIHFYHFAVHNYYLCMIEPISLVSLLFFQYSTSIESMYLTQQ